MSTSQFRFEKHQVAAEIILTTGDSVCGCFFVVSSLATHGGPERVGDLINAEDGFFPFQRSGGATGMFNRAHVVLVKLRAGEEEQDPGYSVALRRPVTVTLSTGTIVEGTVFVPGNAGRDRLSDYVRGAKRFLYVATPNATLIVNSAHIVELAEKDIR